MLHKYGKLFYRNLRMFLLISFIPTLLLGCFSYIIVFRYIQTNSLENAKKSIVAAQNFCQNFSKLLTKLFGKYFRYL